MKLISMTDYVLEKNKDYLKGNLVYSSDCLILITNYANFLKQPLKLGMFVPCDENDVPFSEIKTLDGTPLFEEYQQAKERVIFEDCEYKGEDKDSLWIYFKQCSKEDNENSKYVYTVIYKNAPLEYCVGLELTDSAIKKYNL